MSYNILATSADLITLSVNRTSTATFTLGGATIAPGSNTTSNFVGALSTTA